MYSISKEFHFSASHQLRGLPDDHQCARLHGHNYIVKIGIQNDELNGVGFILDYADLAPIKAFIDDTLDHRHLNTVLEFNPTAERMARWFHDVTRETLDLPPGSQVTISISETPKTWATYSGGAN